MSQGVQGQALLGPCCILGISAELQVEGRQSAAAAPFITADLLDFGGFS